MATEAACREAPPRGASPPIFIVVKPPSSMIGRGRFRCAYAVAVIARIAGFRVARYAGRSPRRRFPAPPRSSLFARRRRHRMMIAEERVDFRFSAAHVLFQLARRALAAAGVIAAFSPSPRVAAAPRLGSLIHAASRDDGGRLRFRRAIYSRRKSAHTLLL